jgi:hypothetical protein
MKLKELTVKEALTLLADHGQICPKIEDFLKAYGE